MMPLMASGRVAVGRLASLLGRLERRYRILHLKPPDVQEGNLAEVPQSLRVGLAPAKAETVT